MEKKARKGGKRERGRGRGRVMALNLVNLGDKSKKSNRVRECESE
jgi:hypothetical protein